MRHESHRHMTNYPAELVFMERPIILSRQPCGVYDICRFWKKRGMYPDISLCTSWTKETYRSYIWLLPELRFLCLWSSHNHLTPLNHLCHPGCHTQSLFQKPIFLLEAESTKLSSWNPYRRLSSCCQTMKVMMGRKLMATMTMGQALAFIVNK